MSRGRKLGLALTRYSSPSARQTAKMNEVQALTIAGRFQVRRKPRCRKLGLQCQQPVNPENGVVKVALTIPVLEAALGILLLQKEITDEFCGFAEQFRREPRD